MENLTDHPALETGRFGNEWKFLESILKQILPLYLSTNCFKLPLSIKGLRNSHAYNSARGNQYLSLNLDYEKTYASRHLLFLIFLAVNAEEKNIAKNIDPNLEYAGLFTESRRL